jgi:ferredoxin
MSDGLFRRFIQLILKEEFEMARVISDDCVSCGTCEGECPVGAISQGDGKFVVDADSCVDCGACEAACPTGAISEA